YKQEIHGLCSLGYIYRRHGKLSEGIRYHKKAIAAARKIGDKEGEADNLCQWGCINWMRGDYELALKHLKRALKISRGIGNRSYEASVLYNIGGTYALVADFRKALRYLEHSLRLRQQTTSKHEIRRSKAGYQSQIGGLYAYDGESRKAEVQHGRAIRTMKQMGDKYNMVWALLGMAKSQLDQGKCAAALACCRQPLEFSKQTQDRRLEHAALQCIGTIHYNLGDFAVAYNYFKQTLKRSTRMKLHRRIARDLFFLGSIFFYQGDYKGALCRLVKALEISKKCRMKNEQYNAQLGLYEIWKNLGNNKKSIRILKDMASTLEEPYTSYTYVMHQMDVADLNTRKGRYADARIFAKKGLVRAKRMNNVTLIMRGLLLLTQIEMSQGLSDSSKRYAEKTLNLARKTKRKMDEIQAHLFLAEINMGCKNYKRSMLHAKKACDIAYRCRTKEFLWKAYNTMGKVYIEKKESSKAKNVLMEAKKIILQIMKKLDNTNQKWYSNKKEVRQLNKNLAVVDKLLGTKHLLQQNILKRRARYHAG
ncbi:MAG: tetratricopeptide repeat protein, partial [bacterium]